MYVLKTGDGVLEAMALASRCLKTTGHVLGLGLGGQVLGLGLGLGKHVLSLDHFRLMCLVFTARC